MSKRRKNIKYVSRAGEKLEFALKHFNVDVTDLVCADFGCSTGGFTECLINAGAKSIYAVDTGYGVLAWKLRNDPRVVVMERTNAMHVILPEKMDFISVDVSWTKQEKILPNVFENLKEGGTIISLVKPHYEADANVIHSGVLSEGEAEVVVKKLVADLQSKYSSHDFKVVKSPVVGGKGGNVEFLLLVEKVD